MDDQTRFELLWKSPIELYGGIKYPLVSLLRIFPKIKNAGKECGEFNPKLSDISYRNLFKIFTYHVKYQS